MQVQNESKPYDSINVTPMLDLAYVLLVIFILMTTASVQGMSINLPKPSSKPSTEKHEVKIIQIMFDGAIRLNGAAVTLPELEYQLKTTLARDFDGRRFNSPNDLVRRSDGAIFFTDPPYGLKNLDDSPVKELEAVAFPMDL